MTDFFQFFCIVLIRRCTCDNLFFVAQVELNEIESSCEEYPLTRAFCHLISTLVDSSVPLNLGAGLRVPGFQPYLNFLRESVFLPFPTRAYRCPAEKVIIPSGRCGIVVEACKYWLAFMQTRVQVLQTLFISLFSVGGSWFCPGGVPQAAAELRASAIGFYPGDCGAAGRAGPCRQAPRTQHHVSPA